MDVIEPLAPEQLRGIVQAKLAELDAYKYMDQVLSAVTTAQEAVRAAEVKRDDVHHEMAVMQKLMDSLDAEYREKHEAMEERLANREAALRAKIAEAQADLDTKVKALATWQDHLTSIENEHKANLAAWQDRIQQARNEHSALMAQKEAVQQQYDALAALIGKR